MKVFQWGLIAGSFVLLGGALAGCATEGSGQLGPSQNGPERARSQSDRPAPDWGNQPGNSTEVACTGNVTGRDILGLFTGLCDKIAECGWNTGGGSIGFPTNPGDDTGEDYEDYEGYEDEAWALKHPGQAAKPKRASALSVLEKISSWAPVQRTLASEDDIFGDESIDIFGGLCELAKTCAEGGSQCDTSGLDLEIEGTQGICLSTIVSCFNAVIDLIPCDGDMSHLENMQPPAACAALSDDPGGSGMGGSGSIDLPR